MTWSSQLPAELPFLLLNDHSGLGLWSHGNSFFVIVRIVFYTQLRQHCGAVSVYSRIGIVLGRKDQVEFLILVLFEPRHHIFFTEVILGTVGRDNGKSIVQIPFYILRVVGSICVFLVQNILDLGI